MEKELAMDREEDVPAVARELLSEGGTGQVYAFHGDLGAGKTTLIKAMCTELGVTSGMSSPTFSIVNEYTTDRTERVLHFDLYRLNKQEELDGIGFDEYLDSGDTCFIEWPELAHDRLPPGTVHVHISVEGDRRSVRANIPSILEP